MLKFALLLSPELFSLFAHGTVKRCEQFCKCGSEGNGMIDTLSEMLNLLLPCLAMI